MFSKSSKSPRPVSPMSATGAKHTPFSLIGSDVTLTGNLAATVDLQLYGPSGLIAAPGTSGIIVAPQGQRVLSLAGFAPGVASPRRRAPRRPSTCRCPDGC